MVHKKQNKGHEGDTLVTKERRVKDINLRILYGNIDGIITKMLELMDWIGEDNSVHTKRACGRLSYSVHVGVSVKNGC